MSLVTGTRLGAYEILSALGAGGMGEVYRALDTRLKREVALKILPDSFAADPERLARFQREAEVLASLNHPHIAAIYGLEDGPPEGGPYVHGDGGPSVRGDVGAGFSRLVRALVMELVEGETLADRIARGPIPVDEALPIAKQIAEALEAAHEQGIIHRDLKPANIKVTPAGVVKVLDFGLAKLHDPNVTNGPNGPNGPNALSMSPTITSPAMRTGVGMILGTAAYMSPEQARGKLVDKRSDIWAFGCVLYEMLTGQRAFPGEDVTETIAAIVKGEPDWTALPAALSPTVRLYLQQCLAKHVADRVRDIGDLRLAMDGAFDVPASAATGPAGHGTPRRLRMMAALAAVILVLIGGAAGWILRPAAAIPTAALKRFDIRMAPAVLQLANTNRDVTITPDGGHLVYFAASGGARGLYTRALDVLEGTMIRRAERYFEPFVSPDGRWIGVNDESGYILTRIPIGGGTPIPIASVGREILGATWGPDDTIVFATTGAAGLWRVPAGGGTPAKLTTPDTARGEIAHAWPSFLPGGRAVLYTVLTGEASHIAVVNVETGERRFLLSGGSNPQFSPTGHLVYGSENSLRAVRFDPATLQVVGDPVTVLEGVITKASGAVDFSVANDGTLVYISNAANVNQRSLTWVERGGARQPSAAPPRPYGGGRVSPDGTRIAVEMRDQESDIWIWDVVRETLTRLTFDPAFDGNPLWSRDGLRIIFTSTREGPLNIFSQAADGSGTAERLTETAVGQTAEAITPDGSQLIVQEDAGATTQDMVAVSLKDGRTTPLVRTKFSEGNSDISPDGRWLAYQSNESGRDEIYVRPFPDVQSARSQVSTSGGAQAVWARDSRELFYSTPDGAIMGVTVSAGTSFGAGAPRVIVPPGNYFLAPLTRSFDVVPDGKRFLMIERLDAPGEAAGPGMITVLNWGAELQRLVPARR